MSKQKIEVCNVSKKFGNSVVLNDVSLEFWNRKYTYLAICTQQHIFHKSSSQIPIYR